MNTEENTVYVMVPKADYDAMVARCKLKDEGIGEKCMFAWDMLRELVETRLTGPISVVALLDFMATQRHSIKDYVEKKFNDCP